MVQIDRLQEAANTKRNSVITLDTAQILGWMPQSGEPAAQQSFREREDTGELVMTDTGEGSHDVSRTIMNWGCHEALDTWSSLTRTRSLTLTESRNIASWLVESISLSLACLILIKGYYVKLAQCCEHTFRKATNFLATS